MNPLSWSTILFTILCITCALIVLIRALMAKPSSDAMDNAFREHMLKRHRLNKLRLNSHRSPQTHLETAKNRTEQGHRRYHDVETGEQHGEHEPEEEQVKKVFGIQ